LTLQGISPALSESNNLAPLRGALFLLTPTRLVHAPLTPLHSFAVTRGNHLASTLVVWRHARLFARLFMGLIEILD
jgi:hypothetical protein